MPIAYNYYPMRSTGTNQLEIFYKRNKSSDNASKNKLSKNVKIPRENQNLKEKNFHVKIRNVFKFHGLIPFLLNDFQLLYCECKKCALTNFCQETRSLLYIARQLGCSK